MQPKSNALARKAAVEIIGQMTETERTEVLDWASKSLEVVESKSLTNVQKFAALQRAQPSKASLRLIVALGRLAKSKAWDNKSWARRLGVSGVAVGAIAFGTQAAGVAALGSAIGVPLALITGAGAALLGVMVDELKSGNR